MFIAALFITAKRWKQPKYLITTEWINKGVISMQQTIIQLEKWSTDLHYSGDGPWKLLSARARHKRSHIVWYHLHEMSRIGESIETQSKWLPLMLGKIEGRRWSGQQRARWLDGITDLMDMNLSKLWEMVKDREAWLAAAHGAGKSQTWLSE